MKEIIFWSILSIFAFWFLTDTEVKFSPFKITMNHLPYAIGFILILIGLSLIKYDERKATRRETFEEIQLELDELSTTKNKIEND